MSIGACQQNLTIRQGSQGASRTSCSGSSAVSVTVARWTPFSSRAYVVPSGTPNKLCLLYTSYTQTYTGPVNYSYRALVTFYADDKNGSDSFSLYSAVVRL